MELFGTAWDGYGPEEKLGVDGVENWMAGELRHFKMDGWWLIYGKSMVNDGYIIIGITINLVGGNWNMAFMTFPSIGNVIIPTDEVIFFRGVGQLPTRKKVSGFRYWGGAGQGWKHLVINDDLKLRELGYNPWIPPTGPMLKYKPVSGSAPANAVLLSLYPFVASLTCTLVVSRPCSMWMD